MICGLEVSWRGLDAADAATRLSIEATGCTDLHKGVRFSGPAGCMSAASANSLEEQINEHLRIKNAEWIELLSLDTVVAAADQAAAYGEDLTRAVWQFTQAPVGPCSFVRVNLFPDGGVSRLRLYGIFDCAPSAPLDEKFDLIDAANGGTLLYSRADFGVRSGHAKNLLLPGLPLRESGDSGAEEAADEAALQPASPRGWLLNRRKDRQHLADQGAMAQPSGCAIFRLATPGRLTDCCAFPGIHRGYQPQQVEVQALFDLPLFKQHPMVQARMVEARETDGHASQWLSFRTFAPQASSVTAASAEDGDDSWGAVEAATPLASPMVAVAPLYVDPQGVLATHLRVLVAPDGGLERLCAEGYPLTFEEAQAEHRNRCASAAGT
eukprot:GHVT01012152.1.p1 GENE.GHVT01012152.1~~GHVT01012152.1.p1  ORF type:complete len:381 (+),score=99.95 GHVT01012152.1:1095-2237(+)